MGEQYRNKMNGVLIMTFLAIANVFSDGLIVVPPTPDQPLQNNAYPLQVNYHHVETKIENMNSITEVDQEFYNPSGRRLEGFYIFPIPENAIIDKFSMFIDGKETGAELLDAGKAKQIYEDIVRKLIDPALLEYYGRGMFKARIFPIEPYGTKRVKISYRETLVKNNGTVGYLYPLNTEKFSSEPVKDISISVSVKTNGKLKNIYCPSHEAVITRKNNNEATVRYSSSNSRPDKDFSLFFTDDSSKFGISLLSFREPDEDGFFFLNISPDYEIVDNDIEPKDITFVLDVSGSMAGAKLEQAKAALRFCVANLNPKDRFEIIRFSTEAEALFSNLIVADTANRSKANRFINNLKAIGGTNIEEALQLAFTVKGKENRPYMIIFITDGKPTIGKTDENELVSMLKTINKDKTKIFTFGIGDEINTHLLDKLTEETASYRTYVGSDEDIEVKISDLYMKVQSPLFTDLSIEIENKIDAHLLYPKKLPDLFHGSSITILGRYRGNGIANLKLKGLVSGKYRELDYKINFQSNNNENGFIASLWAARRIGYLLDQIRLNGEDKELVDEVTQIAKKYGIITPYTSYLIVEDDDKVVQQQSLPEEQRTLSGTLRSVKKEFMMEKKNEFEMMKAKSGAPSVRSSTEVQALSQSSNTDQIRENVKRLDYKNSDGKIEQLNQQVKFIQGRAFYNNGTNWVDIEVQRQRADVKHQKLKYGSKEYFDLIKQNPMASQYLALGRNVSFVMNKQVYEVVD